MHDPEILLAGPAGTGKSRGMLEKMHALAMKYEGMRGLIVRKTLASLGSTALVTWREKVVKEAMDTGEVVFYGGSPQEQPQYKYANGSTIAVGGMDKSSRIMSSEYDVIYVQEATELTEDNWEALTSRLRNWVIPFQQLLADCNPDMPTHWLKIRCDLGKTAMLESRHEENPQLFHADGTITSKGADYIAKLDNLTGVRYHRLRKGQWVAAEGVIFEQWDSAVHLLDRFEIPPEWTRWWAVDFGFTNPLVCSMWAEDPDGRLYLYREVYHTRMTVDQHARVILDAVSSADPNDPDNISRRTWHEPKPRTIVCDHDAEGRVVLSRETGVGTTAAIKTVTAGIQATQQRLRPAKDGKPRLFILRDSLVSRDPELTDTKRPACTAEEIPGYVWDQTGNKGIKEVPLKENDHGCDAMRYLVAARDLGSPRVRHM